MAPTLAQPPSEIISPTEAKFWQEWADKAPNMLRQAGQEFDKFNGKLYLAQSVGMAAGVALGVATFSPYKYVPGKWKWATSVGAVASLAGAWFAGKGQHTMKQSKEMYLKYADMLEKSPVLKQQLADYYAAHITGEQIQMAGIGMVVGNQMVAFCEQAYAGHAIKQAGQNILASGFVGNSR